MKKLLIGLIVGAAFAVGVACGASHLAAPEVAAQAGAPEACVCSPKPSGKGPTVHHCVCGNLDCATFATTSTSNGGISCGPRR